MPDVLTFALTAPMAAFGGVAVGERRTGEDRPARSAILGLLAACLGFTRAEQAAQDALAAGFGIAVRRFGDPGPLLTDYHTAQSAPAKGPAPRTRREELGRPGIGTILTRRDYRMDAAFTVAVWRRTDGGADTPSLAAVANGLASPRFVPYLGRKSCPLSLPLAPLIVVAETICAAFAARDAAVAATPERDLFGHPRGGWVWADTSGPGDPPLGVDAPLARAPRRDAPLHRGRWQFALRDEVRAPWRPA